jgi:predicted glycoside hydrolase/deacetylase ChbG (UPF0249 family)
MTQPLLRPLIVCADDYAISPGVSRGIRELAEAGRISATGAMTCMPGWAEDAAALRPLAGRIAVGLHLTLTDQRPLGPMPTLAPAGKLPDPRTLSRAAILRRLPVAEVAAELTRQLDAFASHFGRPPAFIDGHQFVNQLPGVRDALLDALANRPDARRIWLRDTWDHPVALVRRGSAEALTIAALGWRLHRRARALEIPTNRGFAGFYHRDRESLENALPRMLIGAGERPLLMVHPGHADAALRAADSLVESRDEEFAYLAGDAFPRRLAHLGFRVAGRADMASL